MIFAPIHSSPAPFLDLEAQTLIASEGSSTKNYGSTASNHLHHRFTSGDSTNTSPLDQCPEDILHNILSYCDARALQNARATSNTMRQAVHTLHSSTIQSIDSDEQSAFGLYRDHQNTLIIRRRVNTAQDPDAPQHALNRLVELVLHQATTARVGYPLVHCLAHNPALAGPMLAKLYAKHGAQDSPLTQLIGIHHNAQADTLDEILTRGDALSKEAARSNGNVSISTIDHHLMSPNVHDRAHAIDFKNIRQRQIFVLSQDPDPRVRQIVANHRKPDGWILYQLATQDQNRLVRTTAINNIYTPSRLTLALMHRHRQDPWDIPRTTARWMLLALLPAVLSSSNAFPDITKINGSDWTQLIGITTLGTQFGLIVDLLSKPVE